MSGIEFSRDDDHLLPRDDEDDEDEATDEMMMLSVYVFAIPAHTLESSFRSIHFVNLRRIISLLLEICLSCHPCIYDI